MAANPARDQLNTEISTSLSPFASENLVSRDRFGRPVRRQPAHFYTQAESNWLVLTHGISSAFRDGVHTYIPSTVIGPVPSLSNHATSYQWR